MMLDWSFKKNIVLEIYILRLGILCDSFDFAVFDDEGELEFLIEYQGIQHFQAKSKFGGEAGLRKQQYHDMLKREYCRKHNIKLLLIPYWHENILNYDYIMKAAYGW